MKVEEVILIAAVFGLIAWFLISVIRTELVARYRKRLIEIVGALAREDAKNGRDGSWRWKMMDTVTFDDMCRKFWKPLDSFYPDKSFITLSQRRKS
jgi:hypothetical protein